MYHRINAGDPDVWGSSVTPAHLAEHLKILREIAVPLSLADFVRAHRGGKLPRNAVAVTFDDGYADNLFEALPLLESFAIPATVFITSRYVGSEREFWWDELEQVLLRPGELPEVLELTINGEFRRWELGRSAIYRRREHNLHLKAWEGKPGSRLQFYYSVWQALQPCTHEARLEYLQTIARWAGTRPSARMSRRVLDHTELEKLASSRLIEIGAHSASHALLPAHPPAVQLGEIRDNKIYLESLLGQPLTSFAYPHGSYDAQTRALVKSAGFACACTTAPRRVARRFGDAFQLPRFQVENWSGDQFAGRLCCWLND
jgi:peptidoglycan/xylan/chitin deacetylase (PgdA/CDA1 family)